MCFVKCPQKYILYQSLKNKLDLQRYLTALCNYIMTCNLLYISICISTQYIAHFWANPLTRLDSRCQNEISKYMLNISAGRKEGEKHEAHGFDLHYSCFPLYFNDEKEKFVRFSLCKVLNKRLWEMIGRQHYINIYCN